MGLVERAGRLGGGGRRGGRGLGITRKVIAHGGCLLVARSLIVDMVSIPYLYRRAKWPSPTPGPWVKQKML